MADGPPMWGGPLPAEMPAEMATGRAPFQRYLDLSALVAGDKVHLGGTIDRAATPSDPTTWTFTVTKVILQAVPAVQQ